MQSTVSEMKKPKNLYAWLMDMNNGGGIASGSEAYLVEVGKGGKSEQL